MPFNLHPTGSYIAVEPWTSPAVTEGGIVLPGSDLDAQAGGASQNEFINSRRVVIATATGPDVKTVKAGDHLVVCSIMECYPDGVMTGPLAMFVEEKFVVSKIERTGDPCIPKLVVCQDAAGIMEMAGKGA